MRTDATTVADALEKAADLIETQGLAKNVLEDPTGRLCSVGALTKAVAGDAWVIQNLRTDLSVYWTVKDGLSVLADVVNPACQDTWNGIVDWNNQFGRTAADVIEAMRLAAKNLRNVANPQDLP